MGQKYIQKPGPVIVSRLQSGIGAGIAGKIRETREEKIAAIVLKTPQRSSRDTCQASIISLE